MRCLLLQYSPWCWEGDGAHLADNGGVEFLHRPIEAHVQEVVPGEGGKSRAGGKV